MDWELAKGLAALSASAYKSQPGEDLRSGSDQLDRFSTANFSGYVLSSDHAAFVVFRGTDPKRIIEWLVNIDYAQVPWCGCMVHEGYLMELGAVWPTLRGILFRHDVFRKRCFVTGHSAGGGMAALAAQYLAQEGVPIEAAYVYAAPRVGDPAFAAMYGVPLHRFEFGDDVVPHVPIPPAIRGVAQVAMVPFLQLLSVVVPGVARLQPAAWTYVHAGRVCYLDEDGSVLQEGDAARVIGGFLGELFGTHDAGPRGTTLPRNLLYAGRLTALVKRLSSDSRNGLARILDHHQIETYQAAIGRICDAMGE